MLGWVSEAAKVLQEANKLQLYEKLLELHRERRQDQDRIRELEQRLADLKRSASLRDRRVRKQNAYWVDDIPYCTACWDARESYGQMSLMTP